VQEEVAAGDKVDVLVVGRTGRHDVAGGVPLGAHPHIVRLVVGDVAHRHLGLGVLQAVAKGETGMVKVVRGDPDIAADLLAEILGLGVAVAGIGLGIFLVFSIPFGIGIRIPIAVDNARGGRRRRGRPLPS